MNLGRTRWRIIWCWSDIFLIFVWHVHLHTHTHIQRRSFGGSALPLPPLHIINCGPNKNNLCVHTLLGKPKRGEREREGDRGRRRDLSSWLFFFLPHPDKPTGWNLKLPQCCGSLLRLPPWLCVRLSLHSRPVWFLSPSTPVGFSSWGRWWVKCFFFIQPPTDCVPLGKLWTVGSSCWTHCDDLLMPLGQEQWWPRQEFNGLRWRETESRSRKTLLSSNKMFFFGSVFWFRVLVRCLVVQTCVVHVRLVCNGSVTAFFREVETKVIQKKKKKVIPFWLQMRAEFNVAQLAHRCSSKKTFGVTQTDFDCDVLNHCSEWGSCSKNAL